MLIELEAKVIEADDRVKCYKCGKGFKVGSKVVTRGNLSVINRAYSEKYRIYSGSEGDRIVYHQKVQRHYISSAHRRGK